MTTTKKDKIALSIMGGLLYLMIMFSIQSNAKVRIIYLGEVIPWYDTFNLVYIITAIGYVVLVALASIYLLIFKYQYQIKVLKDHMLYASIYLGNDQIMEDQQLFFKLSQVIPCKVTEEMCEALEETEAYQEIVSMISENGWSEIPLESNLFSEHILKKSNILKETLNSQIGAKNDNTYKGIYAKSNRNYMALGIKNGRKVRKTFLPDQEVIETLRNKYNNISDEAIDELINSRYSDEIDDQIEYNMEFEDEFEDEEIIDEIDDEHVVQPNRSIEDIINTETQTDEDNNEIDPFANLRENVSQTDNTVVEVDPSIQEDLDEIERLQILSEQKISIAKELLKNEPFDFISLLKSDVEELEYYELVQIKLKDPLVLIGDDEYDTLTVEELDRIEEFNTVDVIMLLVPGTFAKTFKFHIKPVYDSDLGSFIDMRKAPASLKFVRNLVATKNKRIPLFIVTDSSLTSESFWEIALSQEIIKSAERQALNFITLYALHEASSLNVTIQDLKVDNAKLIIDVENMKDKKLIEIMDSGLAGTYINEVAKERAGIPVNNIKSSINKPLYFLGAAFIMLAGLLYYVMSP